MADTPYPLPRQARQTAVLSGDGVNATYGPFDFRIFDIEDITVFTRPDDEEVFTAIDVTIDKVSDLPFDFFTVTFDAALPASTAYVVSSTRIHERSAGLTKGTQLSQLALEKELSKQGTVLQEHSRDIDRALKVDYGQPSLVITDELTDDHTMMKSGNRIINGPDGAQIIAAAANAAIAAAAADAAEDARDVAVAAALATDPLQTHPFSVVLGQTVVIIPGDYVVGTVATVHLNGVEIDGWAATTGTTVTFPAITANDLADGETAATMKVRIGTSTMGFTALDGRYLKTSSVQPLSETQQEYIRQSLGLDARYLRIVSMTELPLNLLGFAEAASAAVNKTAFQEGLDQIAAKSNGGKIVVPPGIYNCDGNVDFVESAKNITVEGIGRASRIDFVSGTRGLTLEAGDGVAAVHGLNLNAKDTAGSFEMILRVQGYNGGGVEVLNSEMRTIGTAVATTAVQLGRVEGLLIDDLYVETGATPAGYAANGVALDFIGEGGVGTDHTIRTLRAFRTGIMAKIRTNGTLGTPLLEGMTFRDCNAVGVSIGYELVGNGDTAYRSPLFNFFGGHINAIVYGVFCRNAAQINIKDIDIYMAGAAVQAPIFVQDCTDCDISSNKIYNLGTQDFGAIVVTGTSNGGEIDGNLFQSSEAAASGSAMINLAAGVSNVNYGKNRYRRVSGTGVVMSNLGGVSNVDTGGNRLI